MTTTVPAGFPTSHKFPRDFILSQTDLGVTYVRFTKVNGDDRIMRCTRNLGVIKAILGDRWKDVYNNETSKPFTESALRIFDLDKEEWRTFRIDTVYHVGSTPE